MNDRYPHLEYVISRDTFDSIAATRADNKSDPTIYVMKYINDTFGLLGTVTTIHVEG